MTSIQSVLCHHVILLYRLSEYKAFHSKLFAANEQLNRQDKAQPVMSSG
jgi:hypothetical protein